MNFQGRSEKNCPYIHGPIVGASYDQAGWDSLTFGFDVDYIPMAGAEGAGHCHRELSGAAPAPVGATPASPAPPSLFSGRSVTHFGGRPNI